MTVLRPFLMLASVAFATGFAGYLAVAQVHTLAAPEATWHAPVSATTPVDSWNIGKRI